MARGDGSGRISHRSSLSGKSSLSYAALRRAVRARARLRPVHTTRLLTLAVRGLVAGTLVGLLLPPAPAQAYRLRGADLYVYGHSWTEGYGLRDRADRYPRLLAGRFGMTLHSRGVSGSQVHEAQERLFGSLGRPRGTWASGAQGVVLIQANLNTLRDFGADPHALATARNSLRAMLATVGSTARVEQSSRTFRYGGRWRATARGVVPASGGSWRATYANGSYVQFRASGGEYVAVRGQAGAGPVMSVRDVTAGRTLARVDLSNQAHPAYAEGTTGIPYVCRVPRSAAGHLVRLVRAGGTGRLVFDVRLPQDRTPNPVVIVKEPYLVDWSRSTVHPNGSDAATDAFNAVVDEVAREFPNVIVADPQRAGYWKSRRHLLDDGTHPTVAGHLALVRTVRDVMSRRLG